MVMGNGPYRTPPPVLWSPLPKYYLLKRRIVNFCLWFENFVITALEYIVAVYANSVAGHRIDDFWDDRR